MNKKKLLSFVLCLALLMSGFIYSNNLPTAKSGTTGVYESKVPVTPPEKDFSYEPISDGFAEGVTITGYSGKETKIIIPETIDGLDVVDLASDVFSHNESLTYIKLPSKLLYLSGNCFTGCSSLMEIDVSEENPYFMSIDGVLYYKDESDNTPTILANFPGGKGGVFTVPYGVDTIGAYAFSECYNLTEVNMYNTVITIDSYAFAHCWNLQTIRLSDNLRILRKKALAHCDSLKRIDLPSNITYMGEDAVLGDIDSNDNKFYYFVDGISCTKDSYAHNYLVKQGLPADIIILNKPAITDNDTGIRVIDAYSILPADKDIDIVIKEASISEVENILPTRYSRGFVFDISFTESNKDYPLNGKLILNFDKVCPGAIPSATKVYQQIGNELVLVSGSAQTPFVGAQITNGGRFVILVNDDFSKTGDVDGDGVVSLFDVKAALHASIGNLMLTSEQSSAANADGSTDNKITTEDARAILRLAGGMSAE